MSSRKQPCDRTIETMISVAIAKPSLQFAIKFTSPLLVRRKRHFPLRRFNFSSRRSSRARAMATFSTYQKWRREFDSELKTVTWVDCATETSGGKTNVLQCTVIYTFDCNL